MKHALAWLIHSQLLTSRGKQDFTSFIQQKKYGNLPYNCSCSNAYFPDKYSKQTKNSEIIYSADTVCYFGNNVLHKHKKKWIHQKLTRFLLFSSHLRFSKDAQMHGMCVRTRTHAHTQRIQFVNHHWSAEENWKVILL